MQPFNSVLSQSHQRDIFALNFELSEAAEPAPYQLFQAEGRTGIPRALLLTVKYAPYSSIDPLLVAES